MKFDTTLKTSLSVNGRRYFIEYPNTTPQTCSRAVLFDSVETVNKEQFVFPGLGNLSTYQRYSISVR